MYLLVTVKCEGMHPSESLIELESVNGTRQAFYHTNSILWGNGRRFIDIGNPIDMNDNQYLVDIGREMTDGAHRTWVPKENVVERTPLSTSGQPLTWGQFKALIDATPGLTDDTPINVIDVHQPAVGGSLGGEVIGGNLDITEA